MLLHCLTDLLRVLYSSEEYALLQGKLNIIILLHSYAMIVACDLYMVCSVKKNTYDPLYNSKLF